MVFGRLKQSIIYWNMPQRYNEYKTLHDVKLRSPFGIILINNQLGSAEKHKKTLKSIE
jgi:hypothetical protein